MGSLPSWIVDLNSGARLERTTFDKAGLSDKQLDELVARQAELLADLLTENGIMAGGTSLMFLGHQFHHVDVLFAEVDDDKEPVRLVLVENKLLKNPESKRSVIGQIIEYASRFQETIRAEELVDWSDDKISGEIRTPSRQWVEDNAETLDARLRGGDFLLIICGDSIHTNVTEIISRLTRRVDRYPTSGMQLCLIAMDLYVDRTHQLLVPHLMGRVVQAERQLQISVVDAQGTALKTVVSVQPPAEGPWPKAAANCGRIPARGVGQVRSGGCSSVERVQRYGARGEYPRPEYGCHGHGATGNQDPERSAGRRRSGASRAH